ncbi:hypothetical protein phiK7B1_151 [Pseudomonas phage phiK7B1]|nr:hypothetical protein phiK7B1_151 [Pseudomonas phage phiK7B1]
MKPLTQETPNPKSLRPEPRTWLGRLWNTWGFDTPEQRRIHNQALDAELHELRLRRIAQNGGLDPENETDYMEIQIRRHMAEEEARKRARTIRELTRLILAAQVPTMSRHELFDPRDVRHACDQATRIYDLTHAAHVPPAASCTNKPES